jgi:hypothetical protein
MVPASTVLSRHLQMDHSGLSWTLTGLIIGAAVLFAVLLGFELSWKLIALITGTGFATETACVFWLSRHRRL